MHDAGETGDDIKPTLHYLYKNGIGGILDYAAEDDVQSEGGPASREPENEHIIARTFDYESEANATCWRMNFDACSALAGHAGRSATDFTASASC